MIQRYLGNKSSFVGAIINEVDLLCSKGDYVCDIFAGTMSVAVNLKKNGFNVIANDINSFSYVFGNSYIINNSIPSFDIEKLGVNYEIYSSSINITIETLSAQVGRYQFLSDFNLRKNYEKLLAVLMYLDSITLDEIKIKFRKSFFFDFYTEEGNYSGYKSLRGTFGKRQFFSPKNGRKLDLILNKIREWYILKLISETEYNLLLSVILVSVEKVSNTQGTYHDFIRNEYDPRALNELSLIPPDFDLILSDLDRHIIGYKQDSLKYIEEIPEHKVLYIDPPYNFRQYTSYYFMLNLIADYCKIDNLDAYFGKVKYVRGQNMEDDFSSTFCKNSLFISSLEELISKAKTDWIIMSYYDGKNHSSKNKDQGILSELEVFFKSSLFEKESLVIKKIERTNYQSYGGHNGDKVNELLYIVKKNKL